jgi:hypothetical protein
VLVPFWESTEAGQVLTPSDVYFQIAQNGGYHVDYLRLPITDEQAPIPLIFDAFYERYSKAEPNSDFLFNCQMGRGRTTTGMVVCCLIEVICHGARLVNRKRKEPGDRYSKGEYKLIGQLVQLLEYGATAKYIADACIDACEHIQNLREAIHDYKVRLDQQHVQTSESKHSLLYASIFKRGLNYLIRYFYLIVFANYLMDTCHHAPSAPTKYFSSWLEERKEILYLSTLPDVDLD